MSIFPLTWITDNIAVGHAPMSYDELDSIKDQGVDAIINLCGEYSDLHEIEESAGFEVFFLPVIDETAPKMGEMEAGLEWLDEAVYLGKKVLIHCRHGIGRTGTFVTAYLLRRGFNLKKAGQLLKKTDTRANPTNFSQWWLLRKFGKKEGRLTIHEPDPQNRRHNELLPFFTRYELLLDAISRSGSETSSSSGNIEIPQDIGSFRIHLVEALHLHTKTNITLTVQQRKDLLKPEASTAIVSSLLYSDSTQLFQYRPASCRLREANFSPEFAERVRKELVQLSREVYAELFSIRIDEAPPLVTIFEAITGRFVQNYFQLLAVRKQESHQ